MQGRESNNKACSTACAPDMAGSASSLEKLLSRVKGTRVKKREMCEYLEKIEGKNVVLKLFPCQFANS